MISCRSWGMKSFVALDMAMGVHRHGAGVARQAGQAAVGLVYLAAEGSHGLGRRKAIGWRRTRGRDLPGLKFKLIPHSVAPTGGDLDADGCAAILMAGRPGPDHHRYLGTHLRDGDEKQASRI